MRTIYLDGAKSIDFPQYPVDSWNWMSGKPNTINDDLYAKVAAVFRVANLNADAIASMPFAVLNKAGEEVDTSDHWTNAVGFLPDPWDLLRLVRMSLFVTNSAYLRWGRNVAGVAKSLYYCVPTTISPNFDPKTGDLQSFSRTVNGQAPLSMQPVKDLVYLWRKDHTTEIRPSENTEFRALMASAGILFWADYYIQNYFERGGVKPTLIGVKGVVDPDKREEMERGVSKWIRNLSKLPAKLFNSEAVEVHQIGDGVAELKDNPIYRQAIENAAMVTGTPLSLLLSNSANYATAQTEYLLWFRNSVTPWCNFIAGRLNDQIFTPLGLHFEFRPEMTDPNQEDEVSRASAFSAFADAFNKYPDAETFLGAAITFGFELTEELAQAVTDYYAKKQENAAVVKEQTQPPVTEPTTDATVDVPAKFVPSIEQVREMELWQTFAFRKMKKAQPLDFPFEARTLPADIADGIRARLVEAKSEDEIKAAFVVDAMPKSEIAALVEALNRFAIQ